MREVDNRRDALAAMAAMELLAELVSSERGGTGTEETAAGLGVVGPLLPKLAGLVADGDGGVSGSVSGGGGGGGDAVTGIVGVGVVPGYVRARAATVGARIATAAGASRAGGGKLPSPGGELLLAALAAAAEDEDNEVAEAAMVAAGTLGECAAGAAAMVAAAAAGGTSLLASVVEAALGAAGPSRVAALHALASIAGAGVDSGRRPPSSKGTPAFPHDPVGVTAGGGDGAAAESAIRAAVYDVAASRGHTPAERVFGLVQRGGDSFLELRVAAYRLVASLGRRGWFAAEVAAYDALFAKILDAGGENSPPGCKWRHEAALGLLAAAEAPRTSGMEMAVSDAHAARLRGAVAGGVYGGGGKAPPAIPIVATVPR
jgi:hypothetical protein